MTASITFVDKYGKWMSVMIFKHFKERFKVYLGIFASEKDAEKAFKYAKLSYETNPSVFISKITCKIGKAQIRDEIYNVISQVDAINLGLAHIKSKRTLSESLDLLYSALNH